MHAACSAAGFSPRVAHHAKEWVAVTALVARGFGVCLLPRLAPVPPEHAVRRLPLAGAPAPPQRLVACVRRGSGGRPAVARGPEALHRPAREMSPGTG
ncbi:LysR substrate-binding domain-containing protein [Nocardiopsis tropica]|uniref:LysR substrate-binding domain-containing protein n=1 Tax=Nocardiopsis tropica TaxID=109330 RepID=UPI0033367741